MSFTFTKPPQNFSELVREPHNFDEFNRKIRRAALEALSNVAGVAGSRRETLIEDWVSQLHDDFFARDPIAKLIAKDGLIRDYDRAVFVAARTFLEGKRSEKSRVFKVGKGSPKERLIRQLKTDRQIDDSMIRRLRGVEDRDASHGVSGFIDWMQRHGFRWEAAIFDAMCDVIVERQFKDDWDVDIMSRSQRRNLLEKVVVDLGIEGCGQITDFDCNGFPVLAAVEPARGRELSKRLGRKDCQGIYSFEELSGECLLTAFDVVCMKIERRLDALFEDYNGDFQGGKPSLTSSLVEATGCELPDLPGTRLKLCGPFCASGTVVPAAREIGAD